MRTTEMVLFAHFLKTSKFIPACISIYILSLLFNHKDFLEFLLKRRHLKSLKKSANKFIKKKKFNKLMKKKIINSNSDLMTNFFEKYVPKHLISLL